MRYEFAEDIQRKFEDVVIKLGLSHIKTADVVCIRGHGSSSRGTIARCHALNKVMQKALGRKGFYVLEFLSERFDRMPEDERLKVIIHELMHIPKSFGGGFKYHDYVCEKNVIQMFRLYKERCELAGKNLF